LEDNLVLTTNPDKYEDVPQIDEDIDKDEEEDDGIGQGCKLWEKFEEKNREKEAANNIETGNNVMNENEISDLFDENGSGEAGGAGDELDLSQLQDL